MEQVCRGSGEVPSEPTNQFAAWQEPRPPDDTTCRNSEHEHEREGDWFVPPEHLEKVRERFTREEGATAPH
jgi:hypothetical protein